MHKYALLFPGQGSIKKTLLSSFFTQNKIICNVFNKSSKYVGYNLWKLIQNCPDKIFKNNESLQLVTLISSVAIYKLWNSKCYKNPPYVMAGHSLGEYTALVCSHALKLSDAIKLIIIRNKIMINAMCNKQGLMTVILGLNLKLIKKTLKDNKKYCKTISIACINTLNNIVISGEKNDIEKISIYLKKIGAKRIINLPIHPPSHCIIMKKISKNFSNILTTIKFKTPICFIINNVNAKFCYSEDSIKNSLVQQLYKTVKWHQLIKNITKNDIELFIEVSTNNVLTNLNKHITNKLSISLNNKKNFLNALKFIL